MEDSPIVFIVDDDPAARDSLAAMLESKDVAVQTYASAEDFLEHFDRSRLGCLVADVRMTGLSGLELQERLAADGSDLPVIIVTGYGDIPSAVHAMRTGAVTFLEKPCREGELWENISKALQWHREHREEKATLEDIRGRLEELTPDERQVMALIVAGRPNKVIASELGIGLRTVELRRSNVMRKMRARSLAELVRLSMALQQEGGSSPVDAAPASGSGQDR
jgi:FixJ family two-component response regulator